MLLQVILNPDLQQTTLCVAEHDLHNDFFVILSLPLKKEISNNFIQNFIAYDEFNFSYLDDEYFWLENISITKNILAILSAAEFIDLTYKDLEYIDKVSLKNNVEVNEFENLGYQSPVKTIPRNLSSQPHHLNKFIAIGDSSPKLLQTSFYFENNDLSFIVNKRKINSYQFFHHLNSNLDRIRFKNSLLTPFNDKDKLIKFISSLDYFKNKDDNLEVEENKNIFEENSPINLINENIDEFSLTKESIDEIRNISFITSFFIDSSISNLEVSDNDVIVSESETNSINNLKSDVIDKKDDNSITIEEESNNDVIIAESNDNSVIDVENQVIDKKDDNLITTESSDNKIINEQQKFDNDIKSLEDRFYEFFNENDSDEEFFLEPIKNITDEDIKEQIKEFQKNNPVELKNKKDILKNIKKINIEHKPEPLLDSKENLPIEDVVNYINDIVDESSKLEKNNIHKIVIFNFISSSKIKNEIDESFLNDWQKISLDDEIDRLDDGDEIINEVKEEISIFENIIESNYNEDKLENLNNIDNSVESIDIVTNKNIDNVLILSKHSVSNIYSINFILNCNIIKPLVLEKIDKIIINNFIKSYNILETNKILPESIVEIIQENPIEINEKQDETIVNIVETISEDTIKNTDEANNTNETNFSLEDYQKNLIELSMNNDIDGVINLYKNYPKSQKPLIDFNYYGDNPLCIASFKENIDLLKILIEKGWNPNYFDANLNNALIIAAAEGHKHIVRYLLSQKVQINFKNKKGYTALHFAVNDCNHRIVKLLLDSGTDVNAQDNDKNTPLSIAAFKGDINSTKLLLKTHINVHLKNKQGYDARSIAIISKNNAIAKLIEEKIVNDKNNVNLPPIIEKNV